MYEDAYARAMVEGRYPSQRRIDQVLELKKAARGGEHWSWRSLFRAKPAHYASPREQVMFVPPF